MGYFGVHEYVGNKVCRERAQTGSCSHLNRKGINPCQAAINIQENVEALQYGAPLPHDEWTIPAIADWLGRHVCANAHTCSHKACATGLEAQQFMLETRHRTKAA